MPQSTQSSDPGVSLGIIAALSSNNVIGRNNALPWHLSADLQHFKRLTLGKPIVMGRHTYESIGRPLPGRENIVISRNTALQIPGCHVCVGLGQALRLAQQLQPQQMAMVIGGGQLYRQALPQADWLYLTRIHAQFAGDTFFPEIDPRQWQQVHCQDHPPGGPDGPDGDNKWGYSFIEYQRLRDSKPRTLSP